jgi:hypothetical protein
MMIRLIKDDVSAGDDVQMKALLVSSFSAWCGGHSDSEGDGKGGSAGVVAGIRRLGECWADNRRAERAEIRRRKNANSDSDAGGNSSNDSNTGAGNGGRGNSSGATGARKCPMPSFRLLTTLQNYYQLISTATTTTTSATTDATTAAQPSSSQSSLLASLPSPPPSTPLSSPPPLPLLVLTNVIITYPELCFYLDQILATISLLSGTGAPPRVELQNIRFPDPTTPAPASNATSTATNTTTTASTTNTATTAGATVGATNTTAPTTATTATAAATTTGADTSASATPPITEVQDGADPPNQCDDDDEEDCGASVLASLLRACQFFHLDTCSSVDVQRLCAHVLRLLKRAAATAATTADKRSHLPIDHTDTGQTSEGNQEDGGGSGPKDTATATTTTTTSTTTALDSSLGSIPARSSTNTNTTPTPVSPPPGRLGCPHLTVLKISYVDVYVPPSVSSGVVALLAGLLVATTTTNNNSGSSGDNSSASSSYSSGYNTSDNSSSSLRIELRSCLPDPARWTPPPPGGRPKTLVYETFRQLVLDECHRLARTGDSSVSVSSSRGGVSSDQIEEDCSLRLRARL